MLAVLPAVELVEPARVGAGEEDVGVIVAL